MQLSEDFERYLSDREQYYGLPHGLLRAVMEVESGGNTDAAGTSGEIGAFQLMPATVKQLRVKNPRDFYESADGAARLFAQLSKQFNGDVRRMIAAYNAGLGAVKKAGGIPQNKITPWYVEKVTGLMEKSAQATKPTGYPSAAQPSSYPSTTQSSSYPSAEQTTKSSDAPDSSQPSGYPSTSQPGKLSPIDPSGRWFGLSPFSGAPNTTQAKQLLLPQAPQGLLSGTQQLLQPPGLRQIGQVHNSYYGLVQDSKANSRLFR
jgi:hypothetical protein